MSQLQLQEVTTDVCQSCLMEISEQMYTSYSVGTKQEHERDRFMYRSEETDGSTELSTNVGKENGQKGRHNLDCR